MKIIKAEQKDFEEINCLAEEEFPYTKKNLDKIELRIKKGNFIFVAKDQKTFLGFIEFKLAGPLAFLFGLAVKKEFRGDGIGKKLFDFFIKFSQKNNITKISLIVKKDNLQAKKLYKSNGFVIVKELEKKIENSLIEEMELDLSNSPSWVS